MLTLRQVFDDLCLLCGCESADIAPVYVRTRLFNDIHAALQLMQLAGEDFYAREPLSVTLTANTATYALPKGVQTVLDPVRFDNDAPLRKLTSRAQFMQFGQIFLGNADNTQSAGTPSAYFVESLRDTSASPLPSDDVTINLRLAPPPDSATAAARTIKLDVINEAPAFVAADLCGASKPLPVPHKYAESIFLPIARWQVTTSQYFVLQSRLPNFEADYKRALRLLGLADPRKPKPDDSNSDGIKAAPVQQPQQQEEATA